MKTVISFLFLLSGIFSQCTPFTGNANDVSGNNHGMGGKTDIPYSPTTASKTYA